MVLTASSGDRRAVDLVLAAAPDARTTIASVELGSSASPNILGISAEPTTGRPTVTVLGERDGRVHTFVLGNGNVRQVDGPAWFAGWAADPEPYDPD